MKRRLLLVLIGVVAVAARSGAQAPVTAPLELLIVHGRVLDGTGNPWIPADIGIAGGRIVAMGDLRSARAARTIDAAGLYVTPGFIDVHSHSREGLEEGLNHAQPLLAQGITTVMVSPDGGGPIEVGEVRATFERRGIGVNAGIFVPHGSIRQRILSMSDREPTAAELSQMVELVRRGMKAGAVGLSTGLYYAPGNYAKTEEVIAMAKAAGEAGGVYSSHIRDEGDYTVGLVASVEEVIRIAEEGKLPGIVSHMKALGVASWGLSTAALMRIDAARKRGVQVWADQYPYEASGTGITGALVPRWAQVGGDEALMKRVRGGPERPKLRDEIRINIARRGGPASLQISRFRPDPSIEGRTIEDLAKAAGKAPEDVALDLLERGGASLVSFNMSERDIEEIMKRPYMMTCTDGDLVPMGVGKPHPRAYGAFARKLRLYVRERSVVDLPFAIRSMTHLPAMVFGLKDRGQLRVGAWADVLVFDPEKVADKATYQDPHQLSVGFDTILVNGHLVRDAGRFTGALNGKVVSPERR
jgi:N-acyl-D-aspartate/D-glutamate deacylase